MYRVRLVFLNACDTGQGGLADVNSGVAPALVAVGMPALIANQYKVLDIPATMFAQQVTRTARDAVHFAARRGAAGRLRNYRRVMRHRAGDLIAKRVTR
jgi:hypothetical protein